MSAVSKSAMSENRVRALLEARSQALARRGRSQVSTGVRRPFLLCRAGGQPIALPLSETGGVIADTPSTPVPAAPPAMLGIIALSGVIVTVLDLARAVGLEGEVEGKEQRHLVRLRGRNAAVALSVQRALGVCLIETARIEQREGGLRLDGIAGEPASPHAVIFGHEAVSGYAPRGSGAPVGIEDGFCIVDPARLLRRYIPLTSL